MNYRGQLCVLDDILRVDQHRELGSALGLDSKLIYYIDKLKRHEL